MLLVSNSGSEDNSEDKMILKYSLITATIFSGTTLILQAVAYVIPGWLFIADGQLDFSVALWYVVLCEQRLNATEKMCGTITYRRLFNERSSSVVSKLQMEYSAIIVKQVEVSSCFALSVIAFLLMVYQLKTFLSQTPDQPTIYDFEPENSCSIRSKFFGCGGLAGVCTMLSGVLLLMVTYDMVIRYSQLGDLRAGAPIVLFIEGTASGFSLLSGITEVFLMYRTKSKRSLPQSPRSNTPQQAVPLVDIPGQNAQATFGHSVDVFEETGDYYGHDYDPANPRFHTQGYKHITSKSLFPGYRLGKQNLHGHDKTWWRKVTCASSPLR